MPVKIFFCYAHEDLSILKKLKAQLRPLERRGIIEMWYDRDISAGTEWETEIKERLNAAQIILLLVSPAFMDSDYAYGIELEYAIQRHNLGEAKVIPVILRPINFQGTSIEKLQALPTDVKPVTDPYWVTQDRALFNVAEGIRKVVENISTKSVSDAVMTSITNGIDLNMEPSVNTPMIFSNAQNPKLEDLTLEKKPKEFAVKSTIVEGVGENISIVFSPDEDILASSHADMSIKLWNLYTGRPVYIFQGTSGPVITLAFSPDGNTLIGCGQDYTKVWDPRIGKMIETFKGFSGFFDGLAFIPSGQTLVSSSSGSTVYVRDLNTGESLLTIEGHSEPVTCTAITPNGQTLATGSFDATIKLWNIQTGKLYRTFMGHLAPVYRVIFSPDGQTLASISEDQTIKLWKFETRKPHFTFEGGSVAFTCMAFSPDGQTLASGSADGTIRLWSLVSGQLLQTLTGHTNVVSSLAFSPDGQTLASGSADGTIRLWS